MLRLCLMVLLFSLTSCSSNQVSKLAVEKPQTQAVEQAQKVDQKPPRPENYKLAEFYDLYFDGWIKQWAMGLKEKPSVDQIECKFKGPQIAKPAFKAVVDIYAGPCKEGFYHGQVDIRFTYTGSRYVDSEFVRLNYDEGYVNGDLYRAVLNKDDEMASVELGTYWESRVDGAEFRVSRVKDFTTQKYLESTTTRFMRDGFPYGKSEHYRGNKLHSYSHTEYQNGKPFKETSFANGKKEVKYYVGPTAILEYDPAKFNSQAEYEAYKKQQAEEKRRRQAEKEIPLRDRLAKDAEKRNAERENLNRALRNLNSSLENSAKTIQPNNTSVTKAPAKSNSSNPYDRYTNTKQRIEHFEKTPRAEAGTSIIGESKRSNSSGNTCGGFNTKTRSGCEALNDCYQSRLNGRCAHGWDNERNMCTGWCQR